ncbi:aldo/keto reductase [Agrobacterium vitis]|uniref:aldo/keto reductase n=1 Tax=Agrobacterium vitis TaxID=373 RepID=UPI0012E9093D|nr:aldo/keto reductase [Agrobacterium vitis]MUZ65638.1 aldo/keto reductase [Agrobacterium vitis]
MTITPNISLSDGRLIPQLGFGVWQVDDAAAEAAVREALKAGYRLIDTAQAYNNEAGVGRAIAGSGISHADLFITTKVFSTSHGFDQTLHAFDDSVAKLGLEYVDLYLIHWPSPHRDLYAETWKALIRLQKDGRAKSIGVSNFQPAHLTRLYDETGVFPAVNQIELHPHFQQSGVRHFNAEHKITTESWSPLGQGTLFENPTLTDIAGKHGRTVAQVVLRWHLDRGLIAIPKSVTPSRIAENFAVFDFRLAEEDLAAIDALDNPQGRIGPDPDTAIF